MYSLKVRVLFDDGTVLTISFGFCFNYYYNIISFVPRTDKCADSHCFGTWQKLPTTLEPKMCSKQFLYPNIGLHFATKMNL